MGSSSSHSNSNSMSPMERELVIRRRLLLERSRREQQQWREQRLHDVVILLLDRGEVSEGISLAFQLPESAEVPARRPVRISRNTALSERARRRLHQTMEAAEAEESHRYDPDTLKMIRAPLEEILAEGRPADCLPAPDIMQLLLQGKEVSLSDEEEDEMTTATDEEEENEEMLSSYTSSFASQGSGYQSPARSTTDVHEDEYPLHRGRSGSKRSSKRSSRSSSMTGGVGRRSTTTAEDYPIPRGSFGGNSSRTSSFANSSAFATPTSVDLEVPNNSTNEGLPPRRPARNKKEAAIIRELHHEQRLERKKFRRRTAEEVYGKGFMYTANRRNQATLEDDMVGLALTAVMMQELSKSHRIADVLSPLSPFQPKRRFGSDDFDDMGSSSKKGNNKNNSAFPTSDGDENENENEGEGEEKVDMVSPSITANYVRENSFGSSSADDSNHISGSSPNQTTLLTAPSSKNKKINSTTNKNNNKNNNNKYNTNSTTNTTTENCRVDNDDDENDEPLVELL